MTGDIYDINRSHTHNTEAKGDGSFCHYSFGFRVKKNRPLCPDTKPHGEAAAIFATYNPEDEDMAKLYESVGFAKTDLGWEDEDSDDNDVIVRMSL